MRILFLFITPIILFVSCSPKEKELHSYFCNENLERYFAGNDSLPIININPNDSFSTIRDTVLSLLDFQYPSDDPYPEFIFPFKTDSSSKPIYIKNSFMYYFFSCTSDMPELNWRNVLEIVLNSKGQLLIEGELKDVKYVRELVYKFIINNGENVNYSDTSIIATIIFQRDSIVDAKQFNSTIKGIIDGYTDALNYESKRKFNKAFCDLTKAESNTIIDIIPFNFHLEYPETNPFYLSPPLLPYHKDSLIDLHK